MTTNGRVISAKLYVKWTGLLTYADESANIVSFNGQIRLNPPFTSILANRSMVDQVSINLHNKDNRYSSLLSTGGLYSEINNGNYYQCPMYLQVSVNGGSNYYTIFTGVVKYVTENTKTPRAVGQITLDCRSREEVALQTKANTLATDFKAYFDGNYTESDILAAWLDDAGFSAGDYDLDSGQFCIPYAWLADESPISSAWDLAAACGGRFYMDHSTGKLHYENSTAIVTKTIFGGIGRGDYGGLTVKYQDVDLYKKVSVTIYDHQKQPLGTVYTLSKPFQVAAGATEIREFAPDNPVIEYVTLSYKAATTGGTDITSSVTVTPTKYAEKLSFSIANANANAAYIRLLSYTGYAVESDSTETVSKTSTDTFWNNVGARDRVISNKFVQARAQAASLADMVLTATETPIVMLEISDFLGDPQLNVGDLVFAGDSVIQTVGEDFYVTAIGFRYSEAGFVQNLECALVSHLAPYYAAGTYFKLGTNKLGSSDPAKGRLFF